MTNPLAAFFASMRNRWNLNAKSRKHPNKPSRGLFRPNQGIGFKPSLRAQRFMRNEKPIEARPQIQVVAKLKDRRGQFYARMSTGQIIRIAN